MVIAIYSSTVNVSRYSAYRSVNLRIITCGGDRVCVYFLCWDGLFGVAVSFIVIRAMTRATSSRMSYTGEELKCVLTGNGHLCASLRVIYIIHLFSVCRATSAPRIYT